MSLVRILPKKGSSLAATKRLWKPTALCMISRRDGSKESISRNALATLRGSMSLKGLKRLGVRMGHKYCAWRPEKVRTNISHLVISSELNVSIGQYCISWALGGVWSWHLLDLSFEPSKRIDRSFKFSKQTSLWDWIACWEKRKGTPVTHLPWWTDTKQTSKNLKF